MRDGALGRLRRSDLVISLSHAFPKPCVKGIPLIFVEIYDQSKEHQWTVDYGRIDETEDITLRLKGSSFENA